MNANPKVFQKVHTQRHAKIIISAVTFGDHFVGLLSLPTNSNEEVFFITIRRTLDLILTEIFENGDLHSENTVLFQKDCTPPYYTQPDRQNLDATFPGR